ncbi:GAF and ANTAR domain-containing protein [Cellulomonas sp. URHD0024]|uniref:GAF and ANTAR domain-containing protein n=1 Tax=Cellulomonas sp. URHD0024 TaxID=1302620 RepID=UPI000414FF00|nr:GAF and ANTAR domain-containing protein [Cellulomonas sp. URHD0024]
MTSPVVPDELRAAVELSSGAVMTDATVDTLLSLLTTAAQRVVPAGSGAGLTIGGPDSAMRSVAATDEEVEALDALQYELDEGPCLTAWRDRVVVRIDDVATERRWPRWCAVAAQRKLASSLSAPLVVGDTALGAVKVYAHTSGRFGEHDEATLRVFAAQAAVLVGQARAYGRAGDLTQHLGALLRQRDDINRACGVIMEREGVTADAAYTYLMSLAERDGHTVHEAAARLVRRTGKVRR